MNSISTALPADSTSLLPKGLNLAVRRCQMTCAKNAPKKARPAIMGMAMAMAVMLLFECSVEELVEDGASGDGVVGNTR